MKSAAAAGGSRVCNYVAQTEEKKIPGRASAWKPPLCPGSHSVLIFYSFKLVAIYISILSLRSCLQPTTTAALLRGQRAGPRTRRNVFRCRPENAGCPCMTEGFTSGHCHRKMKHYRFHPPVAKWRRSGCRASADRCWRWGQSNVKKEEREPRRHLDPCDKRRTRWAFQREMTLWRRLKCTGGVRNHFVCVCACELAPNTEAGGFRQLLRMLYVKSLRSSWIGFTPSHLSNGANVQKRFRTFNRAKVHLNLSHTQETNLQFYIFHGGVSVLIQSYKNEMVLQ